MKIINFEEIANAIKVEDLFEPIKQAFIDYSSPKLVGIPVSLLHFADNADAHIKIAAINGYTYFSVKVATMFPTNATKNLPINNGAIFLFDAKTGELKATLNDKGLLTDMRTAATGALITDFLAPKNANYIAIIGTGYQALSQVEALSKLRANFSVQIYGRDFVKCEALIKKLKSLCPHLNFKLAKTAEEAVKNCEIIITTTSSTEPIVNGEWLQKGQHITALGADDTFKNELNQNVFDVTDHIYLDSLELNCKYGEYAKAITSKPNLIEKTTEFGKVFQDLIYVADTNKITVAKLVGVGVQDLAAATLVFDNISN